MKKILFFSLFFFSSSSVSALFLPKKEELLIQLQSVTQDQELIEHYFTSILEFADDDYTPFAVALIFVFARYDYINGFLKNASSPLKLQAEEKLKHLVPLLIQAIAPDSPSEAEEATKAWAGHECDVQKASALGSNPLL
jgi:hypothetical protein